MTVGAGRESHAADGTGPGGEGRVTGTAGLALMVPSAPPGSPVPAEPEAPVMEVLRTMRAMRRLKPDPVPRELLEQLVEAATWAPSASNQQLYSYVVVTDRAQVARLGVLWRDVQRKYLAAAALLHPGALADLGAAAMLEAVRRRPVADVVHWDRW